MDEKALTIISSCGVRWRLERSTSSSMALSRTEEEDVWERDDVFMMVRAGDHAETKADGALLLLEELPL